MRRAIGIGVLVIAVVAYVAGFWPEHRRVLDGQARIGALEQQLAVAEGRIRLAETLGRLLRLSDAVAVRNYGEAATLSSSFFDAIRAESSSAAPPEVQAVLQQILKTRDQVTTAIAATDPALATLLKEHERTLRRSLGYSTADPQ